MRLTLGLALLAASSACVIEPGSVIGKECASVLDCPEPYTCVFARAGNAATCELLREPLAEGQQAALDAGTSDGGGGGAVTSWCEDVRPLMLNTCIATCHGTNTSTGIAGFRLDVYNDTGGVPGAGGVMGALKIPDRILARSMPGGGMPPIPLPGMTPAQTVLVDAWVRAGAKFKADGTAGATCPDGGT
jgi:hypothetical protein